MADTAAPDQQDPETTTVALDETEVDETFADLDENAINLVPYLRQSEAGKKYLAKLATDVVDRIKEQWDANEEARRKRADVYDAIALKTAEKTKPYPGCANLTYPLTAIRWHRITRNMYLELFSDREAFFSVEKNGQNDTAAEALTSHGRWQFKNEITDFFPQMRRAVGEFVADGNCFAVSHRDLVLNRNRHDVLTMDDVVFPYAHVSVEPDLSDMPWKSMLLRLRKWELQARAKSEKWDPEMVKLTIDKQAPRWDDENATGELAQAVQDCSGVRPPAGMDKDAPYVLYKYQGTHALPGERGDRCLCVVVDAVTKNIVMLYVNEEPDWRDLERFSAEQAQFEQYKADVGAFEGSKMARAQAEQMLADPMMPPEEALSLRAALNGNELTGAPPDPTFNAPPAVAPPWMDETKLAAWEAGEEDKAGPEPVKMVPIELFSRGICIENPLGATGMGYGTIVMPLNQIATVAADAFADQSIAANIWGGLVRDTLEGLPEGETLMNPYQWRKVRSTSDDMRKDVIEFKPTSANPQLLELLRMMDETADGLTVSGVISGDEGKSGETFRGVASRMEKAAKQLSASAMNFAEFVGQLCKNNAKLNYRFMKDKEFFDYGEQVGVVVTREMYQRDYRVSFGTDFSFKSQAQKIAEADEVMALVQSVDPLKINKRFCYEAVKKTLLSRGQRDLVEFLGPPPEPETMPWPYQPPPPPPGGAPPAGAAPPEGIPGPKPEAPPQ